MRKIIIGTRGSKLALFQADRVKTLLEAAAPHLDVEIKEIKTIGDIFQSRDLDKSLDKGLFTSELESALYQGTIDLAVHSLKDLPVVLAEGTTIGAYLERDNPCDVWIGEQGASSPSSLPPQAVVGTSSPRRKAQLLALYPHLITRNIRGNIETRLAKLQEGSYQGIILAAAGLQRLHLMSEINEIFSIDTMTPAPGQAVIAVQSLVNADALNLILRRINHPASEKCVTFERLLLMKIGGGCAVPLGCFCEPTSAGYSLKSFLSNRELTKHCRLNIHFTEEESNEAIADLAKQLLKAIE